MQRHCARKASSRSSFHKLPWPIISLAICFASTSACPAWAISELPRALIAKYFDTSLQNSHSPPSREGHALARAGGIAPVASSKHYLRADYFDGPHYNLSGFDINGILLYMSVDQVIAVLRRTFGNNINIQLVPFPDGSPQSPITIVIYQTSRFKLTVYFCKKIPLSDPHQTAAYDITLSVPNSTKADQKEFENEAVLKYGTPTTNSFLGLNWFDKSDLRDDSMWSMNLDLSTANSEITLDLQDPVYMKKSDKSFSDLQQSVRHGKIPF
jgi:hypothetical protein